MMAVSQVCHPQSHSPAATDTAAGKQLPKIQRGRKQPLVLLVHHLELCCPSSHVVCTQGQHHMVWP